MEIRRIRALLLKLHLLRAQTETMQKTFRLHISGRFDLISFMIGFVSVYLEAPVYLLQENDPHHLVRERHG